MRCGFCAVSWLLCGWCTPSRWGLAAAVAKSAGQSLLLVSWSFCAWPGRGCAQQLFVHYLCWWAHGDAGLGGWGGEGWWSLLGGAKLGGEGCQAGCPVCVNLHWAVCQVSVTMLLPQAVRGLSINGNNKHQFDFLSCECLFKSFSSAPKPRNPCRGSPHLTSPAPHRH